MTLNPGRRIFLGIAVAKAAFWQDFHNPGEVVVDDDLSGPQGRGELVCDVGFGTVPFIGPSKT